jgi:hypothetical protein
MRFVLEIRADKDDVVAALRRQADRIEQTAVWANAQHGINPRVHNATGDHIGEWKLASR